METCIQQPLTDSELSLMNPIYVGSAKSAFILTIVPKVCLVSMDEILRDNKGKREVYDARHLIIAMLYRYTDLKCKEIGKLVNRDYSTAINSRRVANELLDYDKGFIEKYTACADAFKLKFSL